MPRYRVTISNPSNEAMADLVRVHHVPVFDHGIKHNAVTGFAVGAILRLDDIARLESAGYTVQRHEDVDQHGRERLKEVGRGNRYTDKPNQLH